MLYLWAAWKPNGIKDKARGLGEFLGERGSCSLCFNDAVYFPTPVSATEL